MKFIVLFFKEKLMNFCKHLQKVVNFLKQKVDFFVGKVFRFFRQAFEISIRTLARKSEFFVLFYNTLVLSLSNYSSCFDLK